MNDYSTGGDPTAALAGMMGAMSIVWLAILVLFIVCYWKIFSKAGFPGALSLLLIVPIVNVILIVWFAFAKWPALNRA
jgi:hypothetical protein